MPRIQIRNMHGKTIDCKDKNENLLDVLLQHTDWMHACGGKGRCTTCKAIVRTGIEGMDPMNEAELKFYKLQRLLPNERLACQVTIREDMVIDVAEENKLPHLQYTD